MLSSPAQDYLGRVLVVDDDVPVLRSVCAVLATAGFEPLDFNRAEDAVSYLAQHASAVDVVLSDLRMPGLDGLGLLSVVRERWPELPMIMMTGDSSVATAVEAMRRGAYHYIPKPFLVPDEVMLTVARAVEHKRLGDRNRTLEHRLAASQRFEHLVGETPVMRELFALLETVAPTDATVLLLGASGTGKEVAARAIHRLSRRSTRTFSAVNCTALTETLLESELFGYVKGAFSGATTARQGLFEQASGGTLFLDEIGDVSPALQAKLLRALQEGEIRPVGANEVRRVDVRVIAATNRDLVRAVRQGTFREDLYYRLNVLTVELPRLRERTEDIPLLAQHFVGKYAERFGKEARRIDGAALDRLMAYSWPGNVRELENVIQRAVVLSQGEHIGVDLLPRDVAEASGGERGPIAALWDAPYTEARAQAVEQFERRYVESCLRKARGNVAHAARHAGLDRSNFRRLARRHRIDPERFRGEAAQKDTQH